MSLTLLLSVTVASAVLYYAAFAVSLLKRIKLSFLRYVLWAGGFTANAALVVNNYFVNGYVPFVSIYQVLTFLGVCFAPIFIYMWLLRGAGWMMPYFMLAPAIIMTGLIFMDAGSAWAFPPALQSPWFVPHVFVYMVSYTMGFVAFLVCLMSFFARKKEDKLRLNEGVYDCVCVVFPFMTFGMLFGAIWANEVWGNFWSWDKKECWSLMTWLVYMLYLHFRRHKSLRKYTGALAVIGFLGIIVTFFFVNIMGGSSNHAYSV